jgi:hypothetical protein
MHNAREYSRAISHAPVIACKNPLKIKSIQSKQPQNLSRPFFAGERNIWVPDRLTALLSRHDVVSTDIQIFFVAKGENGRTRVQDLELKYFLENLAYTVCTYIRVRTYA